MCRPRTLYLFNRQRLLRFLSPLIILRNTLLFGLTSMTMVILTTVGNTSGQAQRTLGALLPGPLLYRQR